MTGHTRIVILVGNTAIKIARLRPIRLLFRMCLFPFQSDCKKARFRERYGAFPSGLWNYVILGYIVNRNEFQYWNSTRDTRVMPVLARRFGYLIIFQYRGRPVNPGEISAYQPLSSLPAEVRGALRCHQACQFAWKGDSVLLVDYGEQTTRHALAGTLSVV